MPATHLATLTLFMLQSATRMLRASSADAANSAPKLTCVRLDRFSIQRSRETLPRIAYSTINPKGFVIIFGTHPGRQKYVNGLELSR
jgi:hypothetical protein